VTTYKRKGASVSVYPEWANKEGLPSLRPQVNKYPLYYILPLSALPCWFCFL